MPDILSRLVKRALRQRIAAIDLEDATPREVDQIMAQIAADVPNMGDSDVCYGMYCVEGLADRSLVGPLRKALLLEYRKRLLRWFSFAIQNRAALGGGSGIRRLRDGLAEYVMSLPEQVVSGYKPMTSFLKVKSEIVDMDKMDPSSAKIYRALLDELHASGMRKRGRSDPMFPLEWDGNGNVWFIPPSPATFHYKTDLSRSGFRWNAPQRRWEAREVTPGMKGLVQVPEAEKPEATLEEVTDWFYDTWLPTNLPRLNTLFNTWIGTKDSSYVFDFQLRGRAVTVEVDRKLQGPKDAVEELRYRYLGRQGRGPWLEVLDRFLDLMKTNEPSQISGLIDRMNNLQHSNGLFLDHFPSKVKAWYEKFLTRKYSAKDSYTLSGSIQDSDLRSIIRWADRYARTRFLDHGQREPEIPLQYKNLPEGTVNWREKGYPRERGYKQPGRQDPAIQKGLEHLPNVWDKD